MTDFALACIICVSNDNMNDAIVHRYCYLHSHAGHSATPRTASGRDKNKLCICKIVENENVAAVLLYVLCGFAICIDILLCDLYVS